jgi:hypothetical protein
VIRACDDLGHGEGLAGAGDAQEDLVAVAVGQAAIQLFDGLRLVAAGLVVAIELEIRHGGS